MDIYLVFASYRVRFFSVLRNRFQCSAAHQCSSLRPMLVLIIVVRFLCNVPYAVPTSNAVIIFKPNVGVFAITCIDVVIIYLLKLKLKNKHNLPPKPLSKHSQPYSYNHQSIGVGTE